MLFGGSGLKLSPEFTSVPHEGKDGHPAFWAQPPLLHALDELADGSLAQLSVPFQQMPFTDAPLCFIGRSVLKFWGAKFDVRLAHGDLPALCHHIHYRATR